MLQDTVVLIPGDVGIIDLGWGREGRIERVELISAEEPVRHHRTREIFGRVGSPVLYLAGKVFCGSVGQSGLSTLSPAQSRR